MPILLGARVHCAREHTHAYFSCRACVHHAGFVCAQGARASVRWRARARRQPAAVQDPSLPEDGGGPPGSDGGSAHGPAGWLALHCSAAAGERCSAPIGAVHYRRQELMMYACYGPCTTTGSVDGMCSLWRARNITILRARRPKRAQRGRAHCCVH